MLFFLLQIDFLRSFVEGGHGLFVTCDFFLLLVLQSTSPDIQIVLEEIPCGWVQLAMVGASILHDVLFSCFRKLLSLLVLAIV